MKPIRLTLYVAGDTPRSQRAIANLRRVITDELVLEYDLRVIDVIEDPDAAESARILTTPTLIKDDPAPARRVTGDLSDSGRVIVALALESSVRNHPDQETA